MPSLEVNQKWARTLAAELAGCGVRHAVICPGSRSAPLALAFADHPEIRTWSIVDERSAGFFALGLGKQDRVPAALVATSGTAGANFYPAVIEASCAHVPLLVITADRPPELHGWGALQTVNQQNFYGSYPRWFVDLGLPDSAVVAQNHLKATVARSVLVSVGRPRGVVHLNAPFREPLAPSEPNGPVAPSRATLQLGPPLESPRPEIISAVHERIDRHPRGLIVCGPREIPDAFPEAVLELARASGYPVLAEATSQVRFRPQTSPIAHYEALLRHSGFASAHRPQLVLRFGGTLISKALQTWLDGSGADTVLFSEDGLLADPNHAANLVVEGDAVAGCIALAVTRRGKRDDWAGHFQDAEQRVRTTLQRHFEKATSLTEPAVAHHLAAMLPPDANLFVSSSMPVRDLDCFASTSSGPLRVFSNRGANGIDGVVSTALGVAAAATHPTVLLAGDLALWHDLGGLLTAHRSRLSLTIVVLNNDGGGIFSFLPISKVPNHFEELFATPHGLGFASAAELFGARHVCPRTAEELRRCLSQSLEGGLHLIEVRTHRDENVDAHRMLLDELAAVVGDGPWA